MFLASVGEPPRPARTPKNLLAGGTGRVRLHNKSAQGLEIPMAVSDARNAEERIAVGVSDRRTLKGGPLGSTGNGKFSGRMSLKHPEDMNHEYRCGSLMS